MASPRSSSNAPSRANDSSQSQLRTPPHNLQAEESLLGAMLLSRDAVAAAVEVVRADHFYKPAHAHVFDAIATLYGAGDPADAITVAEELNRAGLLEAIGGPASWSRCRPAPRRCPTPAATPASSRSSPSCAG